MSEHILITGGAGYLGALLTGELLRRGYFVTVVDELLYGGNSIMAYMHMPNFHFVRGDVCEPGVVRMAQRPDWHNPDAIVHLAAIAGFPACQTVGKQVSYRYNVEAVQRTFEQAETLGAKRFLFASTFNVYGMSEGKQPLAETATANPQSLYAETKLAAEEWLLAQVDAVCAPVALRYANLFGLSPRMRFDLLVNLFVLEAFTRRQLVVYRRNDSRSLLHAWDAVQATLLFLEAPESKIRSQVYNVGGESGNYTKDQVVNLLLRHLPDTAIRYKDLTFGGDIGDLTIGYEKILRELGFTPRFTIEDGITEMVQALRNGMFRDPFNEYYRNAELIVK